MARKNYSRERSRTSDRTAAGTHLTALEYSLHSQWARWHGLPMPEEPKKWFEKVYDAKVERNPVTGESRPEHEETPEPVQKPAWMNEPSRNNPSRAQREAYKAAGLTNRGYVKAGNPFAGLEDNRWPDKS